MIELIKETSRVHADLVKITKAVWEKVAALSPDKRAEWLFNSCSVVGTVIGTYETVVPKYILRAYFRCDGKFENMDEAIEAEIELCTSLLTKMLKEKLE